MKLRVDTQDKNASIIPDAKREEIIALLHVIKGTNTAEFITEEGLDFEEIVIQKLNDIYRFQLLQEQKTTQLLATISSISKGDFTKNIIEPAIDKDNLDLIQKGIAQLGRKLKENVVKSETFDGLFDSINIPFLLFNVGTRQVTRFNKATYDFFQLDSNLIKNIPTYKLFDESLMTIIDSFYLFENDSFTFEHTFLNVKGKQTIVHVSKVENLFDSGDQVAVFLTDITLQKESELKNKEIAVQERSLKLKQDFLSAIDNELKEPLATISALLPKKANTEFDVQWLPNLLHANVQLKQAIDNITLYNTTMHPTTYVHLEEVSILAFVEELLHAHYFHAISNNVFLDHQVEKQIANAYFVDQVKLKIIINNLIANSLKFCKDGTIRLTIDLMDCREDVDVLRFIVYDSYKGEERASYLSVKDIYNTSINPSLSGVETSGLGMLVTINLVEYLGGELSYHYIENDGSYFTFQLALKKNRG